MKSKKPRVKYGTILTKKMICDKCNDGSCEVLLHRKVFKGRESTDDFGVPDWMNEGQCLFQSFNDAKWEEVRET